MAKAKTEAQAPTGVDALLAVAEALQAPAPTVAPEAAPAGAIDPMAYTYHEGERIVPAAPTAVRARVLAQCDLGEPNDVIEVDAELANARADVLDTDPAAVAYAESQRF